MLRVDLLTAMTPAAPELGFCGHHPCSSCAAPCIRTTQGAWVDVTALRLQTVARPRLGFAAISASGASTLRSLSGSGTWLGLCWVVANVAAGLQAGGAWAATAATTRVTWRTPRARHSRAKVGGLRVMHCACATSQRILSVRHTNPGWQRFHPTSPCY
jgi:hypothetical protein